MNTREHFEDQKFFLIAGLLLFIETQIVLSLGSRGSQSISSAGRIEFSYIIFSDNDLIKAKNVWTGNVDFQSTDAAKVILEVINRLNGYGGGVLLINSSLHLSRQVMLDNVSNVKIVGINLPTLTFELPFEVLGLDKGISILIRNSTNITIEGIDFLYASDRTAKHIKFRSMNKGIIIRNCMFGSFMPPEETQPESYFIPHDSIALSPTDGAVTGDVHVVYNFVFEGNYATGAAVDFIAMHNVKNFVIQNNTFIDAAARRWDKMNGSVTNIVGGNSITITGENGIIKNNVFKRVQQPENFYNVNDVTYAKHMGGVLLTYAGTQIAKNVTISNNMFEKTKMGIALDAGMQNITIIDNIIVINASKYAREDGIAIRDNVKYVKVISNKVYGAYGSSIKTGYDSDNIIIQDNWIDSGQREGIRIAINSTNIQIVGNTVKNNGQDLSCSSTDTRRAGVRVEGINVSIINNTICDDQTTPTQTYGIAIEETASDIYIARNVIYGNVTADIRNQGKNVIIED